MFIYKGWHSFGRKEKWVLAFICLLQTMRFGARYIFSLNLGLFGQTVFSMYFHIKRTVDDSLNLSLTVDWRIRIITKDVEHMTFIHLIIFIMNIIILAGPWNTRTFHRVIAYHSINGHQNQGFSFYWPHKWGLSVIPLHPVLKDMGQCYCYRKRKLCKLERDP